VTVPAESTGPAPTGTASSGTASPAAESPGTEPAGVAPFTVVTVCTGNICRSPAVEQALRARFGGAGIRVSSAGTGALAGSPMPEQAARMARNLGGDPSAHAGRQLERSIIEQADLVIALARDHRRDIARMVPRAARYTFTLRELARLLESVADDDRVALPLPAGSSSAEMLRAFVPIVAGHRGLAEHPADPDDDDVIDPFRRSQRTYDLSEQQMADALTRISASVDALVARLGGAPA
jgi:protein-tyrosine phosphatase